LSAWKFRRADDIPHTASCRPKKKSALRIAADFMLRKSFINGCRVSMTDREKEPQLWGIENRIALPSARGV